MVSSVEAPLVHAVVRQESAFNKRAVSSAGARGLMQLMPETARGVAASARLPYSPGDLTESTSYNIALGQAYLGELLNRFGGNYVLALAAYNAGPSRVNQWLRTNGDPRLGLQEAIDWIERIPLSETRNYVQRTLENLQVYRGKMNGMAAPNVLASDMVR
jgi:soluble lytic murein transglycosylase